MFGLDVHSSALGALGTMLSKLVKLRSALWVGKVLSALGLGFMAQDLIYEPLIQQAITAWSMVPADIARWVHALGIDQGVSYLLSAYGIQGASRIFMYRMNQQQAPAP